MNTILAYDLGTGGCKASLYDAAGVQLAAVFRAYETFYPHSGWHEQRPRDWWDAVVSSTRELLATSGVEPATVRCIALSGQSLTVVPLDANGQLLRETVPIWSDTRPVEQAAHYFERVDANDWYMKTGNGFARETYSVFKIMWYRDHEPDLFARTEVVLGSKDYINFRLTGMIRTDHSYASGSGVYDLRQRMFDRGLLAASGLRPELFPSIVESTEALGTLTASAAEALGLSQDVVVFCGGVDNACMALGAGNTREGSVYLSLGSSAWLAVSSEHPVVDLSIKPFVFAHVIPHQFTSATSIFAAGSSFRWLRDVVCSDIKQQAEAEGHDVYDSMVELALQSPIGANRLFFNPSLAGGSAAYGNPNMRGAFLGLDLCHTRADLVRAVLEGITFDLCIMYQRLCQLVALEDDILMVGGGSNSARWRQMFANVFARPFTKANVGQDAASLGAAAVAAVGSGLWAGFDAVDSLIVREDLASPEPEQVARYRAILEVYEQTWRPLSAIADLMGAL
ncbi:MAG: FGGY-family carbohydrate kinase [Chloroflexi bacterium]|nr:FGGY-family carbohydrate kinase [Chloroflexota bacterium]